MLIGFRHFLYESVVKVLFKADFFLHDRNAKANTSTQSEYTVQTLAHNLNIWQLYNLSHRLKDNQSKY